MPIAGLLIGCGSEVVVFTGGAGGMGAAAGNGGGGNGAGGMTSTVSTGGSGGMTSTVSTGGSGGVCGDGVIDQGEECDGMELGGASCVSLGFDGGTLACDPGLCLYDPSGCFSMMENCANGMDDDGDGLVDCDDPDCLATPLCGPVESITGCDPSLCTFTMGAGPNGGDLCTCTIEGNRHPVSDDLGGNLCALFNNGNELTMTISTAGYNAFSVSTCESTPGDSSLAAFDADPAGMANMLACDGDATGEMGFCSELNDSNNSSPPNVVSAPASGQLWIQVDEFSPGNYWNQMQARVIQIELLSLAGSEAGLCNDGIDNDNDMNIDCDDSDCASDPSCQPFIESITGCDPAYCTFTVGAGPNGGDLCSCTIPAGSNPQGDDYQIDSSCSFFGGGRDLVLTFNAAGYSSYSVDSCVFPGDSSIQVLDNAPSSGGVEIACSGDATGETGFCAEVTDNGNSGPPAPSPVPATNTLFINIEEFTNGAYWNNMLTRQIDVELIP